MKKFAVVLAGCGVYDGAEIHESVLTLLSIRKAGADYQVFAPDVAQHHVVNHITGAEMPEKRNVLIESARISRGKIKPLADFSSHNFDALILPGGFGVAKNLCTFAFNGPDCKVNDQVAFAIKEMAKAHKPIGALCISPVLIAKVLGDVQLTIGQDKGTAEAVTSLGANHVVTSHGEVVKDSKYNVFTTPCYMLNAEIEHIALGCENIVKAMMAAMS